jgi:hypothetical protein
MRITEVSPTDAARMVDLLCQEHDRVCKTLTTEASWERLSRFFLDKLRHSTASPIPGVEWATIIVEWARAGHPAADRAIRLYGREMGEQSRFDEMLVSVRAYYLETSGKPFIPFPRGRHEVANMMRNIWIPRMLDHVAAATGLYATRSTGNPAPSVAYFVSLMAKKKGIKGLKETQINRIYWAREKLPGVIEATMPKIPLSQIPQ